MAIWAIDGSSVSIGRSARLALGRFTPPSKPSIQPDERALLFKRQGSFVSFVAEGRIRSVNAESEEGDGTFYTAEIDTIEEFGEAPDLADFRFSLERVKRFSEPYRHFLGKYSELSDSDAQTLRSGRLYLARTALGMLSELLSPPERARFASSWLGRRPRSHSEIGKDLLESLQGYYGTIADLLADSTDTLNGMIERFEGVEDVVLSSDTATISLSSMANASASVVRFFASSGDTAIEAMLDAPPLEQSILGRRPFGLDDSELLLILGLQR